MKAGMVYTLVMLFLMTRLALADNLATLGAPVEDLPDVAPLATKTATFGPLITTAEVVIPPGQVIPVQFQLPIDRSPLIGQPVLETPVMEQLVYRPYTPRRLWVDAEALLWWMRSANLPPLITSSPPGTPRSDIGVLGAPGTTVLFGGPVNGDLAAGGRIAAGYWLSDERLWALEGYFFQLGAVAARASAGTPDNVGRPFINAGSGMSNAELVSSPGLVNGTVQADASTGSLLGAGVLVRAHLYGDYRFDVDALVGYRYLSLRDNVSISENLTATDPLGTVAPLGTNLLLSDNFHTANYFHGADVGLAGKLSWNAWTLEATGRVAVGSTLERVDINGATSITVPGFPTVNSPGGLLALSSNSGGFSRNVFAVAPEMRLHLGYDINARTRIYLGYSFLYWSRVVRAGDQIDLAVNPALLAPPLPGASPLRPAFTFQGTSFWAQGMDIGLVFRF